MQLSHVVLLLVIGLASVLDICDAQDYPVFRRARLRSEEEPVPARVGPRGRKVRVRVRARPVAPPPEEESEEEDSGAVAAFPQFQVLPVRQSLEARVRDDSDLAAQYIPREPARVVIPHQTPSRARLTSPLHQANSIASSSSTRAKTPPILTIRNYSNVNEDGSFTFGYEAADGSFKEETRGVDCVVRGKYGYNDPDGTRREFSYVSGNPCDPNAPQEDEEDADEEEDPSRPPTRIRPYRPVQPRPLSSAVEQRLEQVLEERIPENELPESFRPPQQIRRPAPRPVSPSFAAAVNSFGHQSIQQQQVSPPAFRPRLRVRIPTTTTPAPTLPVPTSRSPVTAPVPLSQGSVYAFDYENGRDGIFTIPARTQANVPFDFNNEVRQIQQYRPLTAAPVRKASRPTPLPQQLRPASSSKLDGDKDNSGKGPVYSSELIYDPSTGQYTTLLVQQLPKVNTQIHLNQRIQGFVQPQHPYQIQQSRPPAPQIILRAQPQANRPEEQPLTNFVQQPHPLQYQPAGVHPYYVTTPDQRTQLATGQIDQFLRTYNVPY